VSDSLPLYRKALFKLVELFISIYARNKASFKREIDLVQANNRSLQLTVTDPEGVEQPENFYFFVDGKDELRRVPSLPQPATAIMTLTETILLKCAAKDLSFEEAYWAGLLQLDGQFSLRDGQLMIGWFNHYIAPELAMKARGK